MKLEKLNDNQIRCTLSQSDLAQRELQLSELAYGSEKANALFREMMLQASIELGFESDNIPLMIEAIPVSTETLVLVVTKVEDPEELDTRFSRFSRSDKTDEIDDFDEDEYLEDDFDDEFEDELFNTTDNEGTDGIELSDEPLPFTESTDQKKDRSTVEEALDLIAPFTQAIAQAKKEALKKQKETAKKGSSLQMFAFSKLDTVTSLSAFLTPFYSGSSLLYKDSDNKVYYLVLQKGQSQDDTFKRACIIASDYGTRIASTYASRSYFDEHFQLILGDSALEQLNELN